MSTRWCYSVIHLLPPWIITSYRWLRPMKIVSLLDGIGIRRRRYYKGQREIKEGFRLWWRSRTRKADLTSVVCVKEKQEIKVAWFLDALNVLSCPIYSIISKGEKELGKIIIRSSSLIVLVFKGTIWSCMYPLTLHWLYHAEVTIVLQLNCTDIL